MDFKPVVSPELKLMDARLFEPVPMAFQSDLLGKPRLNTPARLRDQPV
jgi:propionate CoA-transferase